MQPGFQKKVDLLLDEFLDAVARISDDRHLQRGLARSLLPCSMVAVLDSQNLFIVGQFSAENRFSNYIYSPEASWSPQKVKSSAEWEFGLKDSFLIQFPAGLLDEPSEQRRPEVERIASEHIYSEFMRFGGLLSLLRTKPIFGPAPMASDARLAFLLLPSGENSSGLGNENAKLIEGAIEENRMTFSKIGDLRTGRSIVRDAWVSINECRVVIADLTGPDPGVMYALGIAHTLGKESVLIYPEGSSYLTDIPKTRRLEYEESDEGRARLGKELSEMLKSMLQPI